MSPTGPTRSSGLHHLVAARAKARRRLVGHLVMARDEERTRIASEIHNEPLQFMMAVSGRLKGLRRLIDDPIALRQLREMEASIEEAIDSLRRMVSELFPSVVTRGGIVAGLQDRLDELSERAGVAVRLEDRLRGEPHIGVAADLYRIAQEALTNVERHARAEHVEVTLAGSGGFLLRIQDDGVGFAVDEYEADSGLALTRQRAEVAGGWLRVDSVPGAGTVLEAWLPARSADDDPDPDPALEAMKDA